MNALRTLSIALLLAGALLFATGSLGFASTATDQGISAGVVDDTEAYVGYYTADSRPEGSGVELVAVTNRFSGGHGGLDVVNVDTVVDGTDNVTIDNVEKPTGIQPGNMGSITGDIVCEASGVSGTVSVTIEAKVTSASARIQGDTAQREFGVECQ